jgi:hypothetical protein
MLAPEKLVEMLASGDAPDEYRPHLMTLLDETPLPVVIKAIQEAGAAASSNTISVWKLNQPGMIK